MTSKATYRIPGSNSNISSDVSFLPVHVVYLVVLHLSLEKIVYYAILSVHAIYVLHACKKASNTWGQRRAGISKSFATATVR